MCLKGLYDFSLVEWVKDHPGHGGELVNIVNNNVEKNFAIKNLNCAYLTSIKMLKMLF